MFFFILDTVLLTGNKSVTLMQEFSAIFYVMRCQKLRVCIFCSLSRLLRIFNKKQHKHT